MKPFGWGFLKGRTPATRITINFIVSIEDMREVMIRHAAENWDEETSTQLLPRHQVEQIIRRAYAQYGEGDALWGEELTTKQLTTYRAWADRQLKNAFIDRWSPHAKRGRL
jgi:hypothetical protein